MEIAELICLPVCGPIRSSQCFCTTHWPITAGCGSLWTLWETPTSFVRCCGGPSPWAGRCSPTSPPERQGGIWPVISLRSRGKPQGGNMPGLIP